MFFKLITTLLPALTFLSIGCASPTAWASLGVQQDRLTDERSVTFQTNAVSHNLGVPYDAPTLWVRCYGADTPDVMVHWGGQYIAGDSSGETDVAIRYDSHRPLFENWHEAEGNEVTFTKYPRAFVNRASRAESVYIQLTDFFGEEFEADFELNGLADVMAPHSDLCKSPTIMFKEFPGSTVPAVKFYVSVSNSDYEPLFTIGSPELEFTCRQSGEKNVNFRKNVAGSQINYSDDLYESLEQLRTQVAQLKQEKDIIDGTVQFDNQSPYPVMWKSISGGLESPYVLAFFDNARISDKVIVRATPVVRDELKAEFDIAELGDMINAHPYCSQ